MRRPQGGLDGGGCELDNWELRKDGRAQHWMRDMPSRLDLCAVWGCGPAAPGGPHQGRARRGSRASGAAGAAWPGYCKGKAHRREYLGYGGRRVLVSRKWSGKTLAGHRADRKAWLLAALGIPADSADRYAWEVVTPSDPDHMPMPRRLLHVLADRASWQAALAEVRRRVHGGFGDLPATGRAA